MEIHNENGIIAYETDGFLDCLTIRGPRVIDWGDCKGTIGRYFVNLPYDREGELQLEILQHKINNIHTLEDFLNSGFLKLLKTGNYQFEYSTNTKVDLLYNNNVFNSNEIIFKDTKKVETFRNLPLASYLYNYYPQNEQVLFTQPIESINLNQLEKYKEDISNGIRPIAIVLQGNEVKYLLDGHHKLLAYRDLKIKPDLIIIKKNR